MLKNIFSKKIFKVAVILAVCGLLIFLNPKNIFKPLRSFAWSMFSPFQKIAYIMSLKIGNYREFIFSIGELKTENEKLLIENQNLEAQNAKLSDLQRRNEILEKQLDLWTRDNFDLEYAYIVSQDPSGSDSWLEISKGSAEGIQEGMPVISGSGTLVGKIGEVQKNSSQVVLITSPQSKINAVTSKNGTRGIIEGKYGLGIIFNMVLQTDLVEVGDKIITSGMGGNVPRGLFIGDVRDVMLTPDRLFQQAAVISPVKFSKLEVISVIKEKK